MKIAIIPARGGSKRIPKKNIKDFCGKPIISYSIKTAIASNLFDKIIVSTDDNEIANISKSYGAEIPFLRPRTLSGDEVNFPEVIAHAVNFMKEKGHLVNEVCGIYATAPFMMIDDLIKGYNVLKTNKWNFVFSATEFVYPIFRSFEDNKSNGLKMFFPKYLKSRTQDCPKAMHDAGQFCWAKANSWTEKELSFDNHSTIVELPSWRVQRY